MKKLVLVFLLMTTGVFAMPPAGGEFAMADAPEICYMTGLRYGTQTNLSGTMGVTIPLGNNFYQISYGDVGNYGGSLNLETAYLFDLGKGWFAGPMLGPDFMANNDVGDGDSPITYITMATGGLLGKTWDGSFYYWGFWSGLKWQNDLDTENQYEGGIVFGCGLHFGF